jgi:hypothetical protein
LIITGMNLSLSSSRRSMAAKILTLDYRALAILPHRPAKGHNQDTASNFSITN